MIVDADTLVRSLASDPVNAFDRLGARIPELAAMADCPQPVNHHSEGDVWQHTRLSLEMLTDLERQVAYHAGAELEAAGRWPLPLPSPPTLTRTVAVLLHDVGKPPTRRGPEGAWTYYGHDRVGSRLAVDLVQRLGLPAAADRLGLDLDVEAVGWLVDNHLFWLNTRVDEVSDAAVRRRYVDDWHRGDDLRVLSWADTLGSRGPDGRPSVDLLVAAEQRLHETRERAMAPPPTPPVRGDVVLRILGIAPGPRVGAVLDWLAARDLTGSGAATALREQAGYLRGAPLDELRAAASRLQADRHTEPGRPRR